MIEVRKEHFEINRNKLEEAVLQQASLFDLYASECEKQRSKVDKMKNSLEYKSALLKIKIREEAESAKIKMTQDQVDCKLLTDLDITALKNQILEEEEYLGQLKAAVEAMRHKRDSLEIEKSLVLSKFSMTTGDVAMDTKAEAYEAAMSESMRRSMSK